MKFYKYLKFGWTHSVVPSLPSITYTLPIAVKKHAKTDSKLFFFLSSITGLLRFDPNILSQVVAFTNFSFGLAATPVRKLLNWFAITLAFVFILSIQLSLQFSYNTAFNTAFKFFFLKMSFVIFILCDR